MFTMNLILKKTYYTTGYFNIGVELVKKYINKKSGICKFKINGMLFEKKYSTANEEGQIRVYGNRELYNFFHDNFKMNMMIEIEFLKFD
ncbi:MAG: hypothetical protein SOY68_03700 [Fusobacterium varium]|uniref:hypothetical protein n=1 Tax=Fusobacterium varium TaxID=856 RepID=UPI002430BE32|nr:hypothetical protein [Fusobacterium varium]MCI6033668.1 hypothetical protein [Fusobacterium varium]MDY4004997.1 hypothetical protein [Fusobacterium varium]